MDALTIPKPTVSRIVTGLSSSHMTGRCLKQKDRLLDEHADGILALGGEEAVLESPEVPSNLAVL